MAYGMRAVSKNEPCPVCSKIDWCGFLPIEDGMEQVVCQRDMEKTDAIGYDGKFYVYVGNSRNGHSKYEEATQRMQRMEKWKRENKTGSFKERSVPKKQMTVVDSINPLSNQSLDKIYRALLDTLVLDDIHKNYLLKEGWSEDLIKRHNIKSFPEKDYIRFRYGNHFSRNPYRKTLAKKLITMFGKDSLIGVPGAYMDDKNEWTFAGAKGILFPVYDADNYLYRLRIRMDFMDVNRELNHQKGKPSWYEERGERYCLEPLKGFYTLEGNEKKYEKTQGKYRNFSSYHLNREEYENGFIVNDYKKGCEAGNQIGVYMQPERDNMYICYVTEGEKKGIFCNHKLRTPFLSIPGVNSWGKLIEGRKGERIIDRLKDRGVGMIVIAYDADKSVNEKVWDSEQKVIGALKKEGFAIGVAEWDMVYGKGIDDLLVSGRQPEYLLV